MRYLLQSTEEELKGNFIIKENLTAIVKVNVVIGGFHYQILEAEKNRLLQIFIRPGLNTIELFSESILKNLTIEKVYE